MVVWIIIGVVALAVVAWAFFYPNRRGIIDRDLTSSKKKMMGRTVYFDRQG